MSDYSKDMYRQIVELIERNEALQATIKEQSERIENLEKLVSKQEEQKQEMERKINRLQEEISRLKSRNDNNSSNTSNPTSTDQKGKKPNKYNGRQKTGKRPGGQTGHDGKTLTKEEAEELIASGKVKHSVKIIGDSKSGSYRTQYVVDARLETEIIEYRIYDNADYAGSSSSDVVYGSNLKALIVTLYGVGVVSISRIREILHSLTSGILSISQGTIYDICRRLSKLAGPSLNQIEKRIMDGEVAYTDATVVTINGKIGYIRNVSNADAVRYYPMEDKKQESLEKLYLLAKFAGIWVHDHETTLYHFGVDHGECNVHLIRYLLKNTEDCKNSWSGKMRDLLLAMNVRREALKAAGQEVFPSEEIDRYFHTYDEIIRLGRTENEKTSPKWAKKDEKALLNRLEKFKKNHLLFLKRMDVAFSNNLSERDLRKCKNRQKMAGGFRNIQGCRMYADILSIIETAKRKEMSVFNVMAEIFETGSPVFQF